MAESSTERHDGRTPRARGATATTPAAPRPRRPRHLPFDPGPELGTVPGLPHRRGGLRDLAPEGQTGPALGADGGVRLELGGSRRILPLGRPVEPVAGRCAHARASGARPLHSILCNSRRASKTREREAVSEIPRTSATSRWLNPSTADMQKGRAGPLPEARHGIFELEAEGMVGGGGRQIPGRRRSVGRELHLGFALPAPHLVVAGVEENPVDPGREAGASPKSGGAAVDLEKDLLHRVLRVGDAAEQIGGDRFHPRAVPLVEPFERGSIATLRRLEQRVVRSRRVIRWGSGQRNLL